MKLILLLFITLQYAQAAIPKPLVKKLASGLTIAVFEDHKIPLVDYVLLVPYGSIHDPSRKSGTAQLMMEMLDRGSGEYTAAQFAKLIENKGANIYATLDNDSMTLGVHGLSSDRDSLLDLFLKWTLKPKWDPEEFKKEKAKLLDRWSHLGDQTNLLSILGFHRRLASRTSYARGSLLSETELKTVNLSDVIGYYESYFKPNQATLLVVGDVDSKTWLNQAIVKLEQWKGAASKPVLQKYVNPRFEAPEDVIIAIDKPGAMHADIKFGVHAPSFTTKEHYDLLIANSIFGETFTSWLNAEIRDKSGYVYSIGSSFSHSVGFSLWGISTSTSPEQAGFVLKKMKDLYKNFQIAKFNDSEVTGAQEYLVGSFSVNNSTLGQVASRWLAGRLFQLPDDYLETFVDRIRKTNLGSVIRATQAHFTGKVPQVVISCDRAKCEKALVSAGFKRLKWLAVSDLK